MILLDPNQKSFLDGPMMGWMLDHGDFQNGTMFGKFVEKTRPGMAGSYIQVLDPSVQSSQLLAALNYPLVIAGLLEQSRSI